MSWQGRRMVESWREGRREVLVRAGRDRGVSLPPSRADGRGGSYRADGLETESSFEREGGWIGGA